MNYTMQPGEFLAAERTWSRSDALRRLYPNFQAFLEAMAIGRNMTERTSDGMRLALAQTQLEEAARWAADRLAAINAPADATPYSVVDVASCTLWCFGRIDNQPPTLDPQRNVLSDAAIHHALDRLPTGAPVTVRLSTFGGSVIGARAIVRTLLESGRRISIEIDHMCWSAGTLIAAAGDHCAMREGATWMLHPSTSEAHGSGARMRRVAARLERGDENGNRFIANRRGIPLSTVRRLTKDERFIEAAEALHLGLIDEILPALPPPSEPQGQPK